MQDPSNAEIKAPYNETLATNGDTVQPRLQVTIVGSGLAGLATARILREHHDVTIIEHGSPELATGGQGIVFFTSTVKILKTIGYDTKRVKPCQITYFRHYDRLGGSERSECLGFEERYGADPWSQLRSDCRDELFRLASAPAAEIGLPNTAPGVKTMFNTPVVDVDPENAVVTLGDGSTRQADLVIIADGIHSRLRNRILGNDSHVVKKMGLTIFRVAVPVSEAKKVLDELPHWMVPDKEGKGCITYFQSLDDTNRLIVTYPLRNFEYIHCSLHLPTGLGYGTKTQSWHADANRQEIIDAFHGFDPTLLKLVRIGTQVKVWDMQDLDPIPYWNCGHTIVIGDAAHAMTPMQGQGANMALEDAEAFRLFGPGSKPSDISHILQQIDSIRRPRTTRILETTRQTLPNTNMKDRIERFNYNNSYNGIVDALQREGKKVPNVNGVSTVS